MYSGDKGERIWANTVRNESEQGMFGNESGKKIEWKRRERERERERERYLKG